MKNSIYIIIILISLVGCKSPTYTAQTKSELAKLCVYEFPPTNEPVKIERDTVVLSKIVHIKDSVDCTDKIGIQYINRYLPSDTVKITETIYLQNSAQDWYVKDLEFNLEKAEQAEKQAYKALNKEVKKRKRIFYEMGLIVLLLAGALIFKIFRI